VALGNAPLTPGTYDIVSQFEFTFWCGQFWPGDGATGLTVIAQIVVNAPPSCATAAPSVASLWPPDHQYVPVDITVSDPDGDDVSVVISSIRQDEAVNAKGSGNTSKDGKGVGTSTAEVRAERVGSGNGRVYTIAFTATDPLGGTCTGTVTVGVPHDQGGSPVAVDDGPLYDSTV